MKFHLSGYVATNSQSITRFDCCAAARLLNRPNIQEYWWIQEATGEVWIGLEQNVIDAAINEWRKCLQAEPGGEKKGGESGPPKDLVKWRHWVIHSFIHIYVKQTWSNHEANVFKIRVHDVCSKFASSCKQDINQRNRISLLQA